MDETIKTFGSLEDAPTTVAGDPLVGQLLDGRYEVRGSLDKGGMATVYIAFDRQLQRQVVVKIPHVQMMADPTFRARFLQEIRDLAKHEHPGIVRIEAWGEHGELPFAVMQYLGGGNLRDRIQDDGGQQTLEEVMLWLPRIADALDFMHRAGSLHRDVKPANILFDERGNAILSDFGIATAIGAADPNAATEEVRQELTVVGTFVGSPAYAPPEAIDRLLTPGYDQYSLATVVYLAIAGELPFMGQTPDAILVAKVNTEPAKIKPNQLKGSLPKHAEKAIFRALSRDPAARFDTCHDFVEALSGHAVAARPTSVPWLKIGAAALLVAGLAIAIPMIWQVIASLPATAPGTAVTDDVVTDDLVVDDVVVDDVIEDPEVIQDPEITPPTSATITATLGSRPEEIERAISLCFEGGGDADLCTRALFKDEKLREVSFTKPYRLDRREVTNAEFAEFVDATGHRTTAEVEGASTDIGFPCNGCNWRQIFGNADRQAIDHPNDPVVHVSAIDAEAYCRWKGGRLPSEDEWEFAARGKDRRTFPWGDEWDPTRLSVSDGSQAGPDPVGSHPAGATPDGILDMAGSVWEWTSTPFEDQRVFKGGSWTDPIPSFFRSAAIGVDAPTYSSSALGIRCLQEG